MKRMIMWLIGLLVMVSTANAQLRKGDLLVGGNIGLTLDIGSSESVNGWGVVSNSTDVDVTFSLTPAINYMLTDNWYIGGGLGLSVAPGGASLFTIGPSGGYYVPFNRTIGMMNTVGMGVGVLEKTFTFTFGYTPELASSLSNRMYLITALGSLGYNSGSKSFTISLLREATLGFCYAF